MSTVAKENIKPKEYKPACQLCGGETMLMWQCIICKPLGLKQLPEFKDILERLDKIENFMEALLDAIQPEKK